MTSKIYKKVNYFGSMFALITGVSFSNAEMIHKHNTVTVDTDTKLMWQDDSEAKTVERTWQGANNYCRNLSLAGYNDWKLPDSDTLKDLYTKRNGLSNVDSNDGYWSSSSDAGDRRIKSVMRNGFPIQKGGCVWFSSGKSFFAVTENNLNVRCVRVK